MHWQRFFVLRAEVCVTPSIAERLMLNACEMARQYKAARRVKTDEMDGRITTQFAHTCIGSVSGQLFEADVETERGSGKVRFIVKMDLADDAIRRRRPVRWVSQEGTEDGAVRHPGESAHLN